MPSKIKTLLTSLVFVSASFTFANAAELNDLMNKEEYDKFAKEETN